MEDHVAVTIEALNRLRDTCALGLHWQANGLHFGIGIEVEYWLATGLNVLAKGSCQHLSQASARFPQLRPILIEVSSQKLGKRLRARGLEDEHEVLARIERALSMALPVHPRLRVLRNGDALEIAGEALQPAITGFGNP